MGGLLVSYGLHWIAIRSHVGSVGRLTKRINQIATGLGSRRVMPTWAHGGVNFWWVIAAIILCSAGAWWGIPLVLAGAMQRRYMTVNGVRIHRALGEQLRDAIAMNPQPRAVPGALQRCPAERCGARVPSYANYCPRCGSRMKNAER